ncbi:hypothetical protein SeMB42_g00583 [Synchytrium endobioticum]|uniref:Cleavage and polyadenylation specificity factor subunit 5 n=1 Tax=Synchytrium endobioticum TaxID=286115 RepID=A0A507DSD9_9FUNG|nr:hypothetical protein SeMB42_g00583 [Synchytrium endobioticum]
MEPQPQQLEGQSIVTLHPLPGYTFGVKEPQMEEDPSVAARLARLQAEYGVQGMRRSVEAVLVVHDHGHPHILMMQIANTFFKLPAAPGTIPQDSDWEIGELLTVWWRPNFETFMYPYIPPHITQPKEMKKVYMVKMPPTKLLSVPKNMKLLAVPLFELYDNSARYGPQLAALPHLLARFHFHIILIGKKNLFIRAEIDAFMKTPWFPFQCTGTGKSGGEKVMDGHPPAASSLSCNCAPATGRKG